MSGDKTKLPKQIVEHIISNSPFFRKILYAKSMEMSSNRHTLPQRKDWEENNGSKN